MVCDTQLDFVVVSKAGNIVSRLDPRMEYNQARFSSDGSEIYFFGRRTDEWGIWSIPVAGGQPTMLVAFDDPSLQVFLGHKLHSLTVGPDRFYVTISQYESDIYVMDLEY